MIKKDCFYFIKFMSKQNSEKSTQVSEQSAKGNANAKGTDGAHGGKSIGYNPVSCYACSLKCNSLFGFSSSFLLWISDKAAPVTTNQTAHALTCQLL